MICMQETIVFSDSDPKKVWRTGFELAGLTAYDNGAKPGVYSLEVEIESSRDPSGRPEYTGRFTIRGAKGKEDIQV